MRRSSNSILCNELPQSVVDIYLLRAQFVPHRRLVRLVPSTLSYHATGTVSNIPLRSEQRPIGEPAGLLWTWWQGDALPPLPILAGFRAEVLDDYRALAELAQLDESTVLKRLRAGHHPYIACLGADWVGYGWCATREAMFGSQRSMFAVPPGDRYLWDFATLTTWRGYGVYPHLLQAILRTEGVGAERFWIIHHRTNVASARGIAKAGFTMVGQIYTVHGGGFGLAPKGSTERARAGALLLGLPLLRGETDS
jgi:hypothetical protein